MKSILYYKSQYYKIFEFAIYIVIFLLSLRLIHKQVLFGHDYKLHISIINFYLYHSFYVPHPGFHIIIHILSKLTALPYVQIVSLFMAFVIIGTIKITEYILQILTGKIYNPILLLFASIAINIAIACYIPSFNQNMYLGQWSPNIWHSPTYTLLKPFALLSFFLIILYFKTIESQKNKYLIRASIMFAIGTVIKPSFIICLIPALFIYLLFFKKIHPLGIYLKMAFMIFPSILILLFQYIQTYNLKETQSYFHDTIIFTCFGVMKLYTHSIIISIFLVLAFPLTVLFFEMKNIAQNKQLILCWILIIVSYLIAGLFAEKIKFCEGAFIFSFNICLYVLYVFSLGEYCNWFKYIKENKIKIIVTSIIFSFHVFSGILYLYGLLKYGTFIHVQ